MRLDEGKKLGGVRRCYQITGVKDRALDLEIPTCFILRIMNVDHTLYFGGLDDWIECSHLICDLDHLSCYGSPRSLRWQRKEIGVEAFKEVTKSFGAGKVLVLYTRSVGSRVLFRSIFVDPYLIRISIGVYQIF